jgi:hypothetical protein
LILIIVFDCKAVRSFIVLHFGLSPKAGQAINFLIVKTVIVICPLF